MSPRCWWLTPVILAIQEAEIRRILNQIVLQTQFQKNPSKKQEVGGLVE
jgi:hypothetical protein